MTAKNMRQELISYLKIALLEFNGAQELKGTRHFDQDDVMYQLGRISVFVQLLEVDYSKIPYCKNHTFIDEPKLLEMLG